jgi:hypothetical protein
LDDKYDEYILFCQTNEYDQGEIQYREDQEIPPSIIAFVVPKERLEIETFIEGGITYQTVTFPELLLTEDEHLLIPASEKNNVVVHNKRALAQLMVSALMLGKMKSYFDNCVSSLHKSRQEVKDNAISQFFLMEFTKKIFGLESTLYLVSSMFDSYDGRDMKLEGIASKIIAEKHAEQVTKIIPNIVGHVNVNMGALDDYFGFWNGFLEGSHYNQLIVGLSGLRLIGPYANDDVHKVNLKPFFPRYVFREFYRSWMASTGKNELKKLNLSRYVNGNFIREADDLESSVINLKWATETLLKTGGRNCVTHQMDIMRLGMMPVSLLEVTSCISRASRSNSNILEGFDADFILSKTRCREVLDDVKYNFSILQSRIDPMFSSPEDKYRIAINRRNFKYGGYFAFSPLDKVHY